MRLLGVWAHPDDEAYLSAGLMARVTDAGGAVAVVTATRGEAGAPGPREQELRASLAIAGVRDVEILGYPDGGCRDVDASGPIRDIVRAIERFRPDTIVTFGPDGITGHPDHIAVHEWTTAAWEQTRRGDLLYATMMQSSLDEWRALHTEINLFEGPEPQGALEEDIALSVDLDERELDRKRAALAAHASQTAGLAALMGEADYRRWVRRETFRPYSSVAMVSSVAGSSVVESSSPSQPSRPSAADWT